MHPRQETAVRALEESVIKLIAGFQVVSVFLTLAEGPTNLQRLSLIWEQQMLPFGHAWAEYSQT